MGKRFGVRTRITANSSAENMQTQLQCSDVLLIQGRAVTLLPGLAWVHFKARRRWRKEGSSSSACKAALPAHESAIPRVGTRAAARAHASSASRNYGGVGVGLVCGSWACGGGSDDG